MASAPGTSAGRRGFVLVVPLRSIGLRTGRRGGRPHAAPGGGAGGAASAVLDPAGHAVPTPGASSQPSLAGRVSLVPRRTRDGWGEGVNGRSGLHIAFMGCRGIPQCWTGFETFAEELSTRLVELGHDVTVYCREEYSGRQPGDE